MSILRVGDALAPELYLPRFAIFIVASPAASAITLA